MHETGGCGAWPKAEQSFHCRSIHHCWHGTRRRHSLAAMHRYVQYAPVQSTSGYEVGGQVGRSSFYEIHSTPRASARARALLNSPTMTILTQWHAHLSSLKVLSLSPLHSLLLMRAFFRRSLLSPLRACTIQIRADLGRSNVRPTPVLVANADSYVSIRQHKCNVFSIYRDSGCAFQLV